MIFAAYIVMFKKGEDEKSSPFFQIVDKTNGMAAAGGIVAVPTDYPQNCHYGKTAGGAMPRPYRAMHFYCPVGRGDLTPPGNWQ